MGSYFANHLGRAFFGDRNKRAQRGVLRIVSSNDLVVESICVSNVSGVLTSAKGNSQSPSCFNGVTISAGACAIATVASNKNISSMWRILWVIDIVDWIRSWSWVFTAVAAIS